MTRSSNIRMLQQLLMFVTIRVIDGAKWVKQGGVGTMGNEVVCGVARAG